MLVPDESAPFRLHLFGTPALCGGGVTTRLAVPAKAVALLAILVVHFGTPQLRTRLAELLWPETTDEEARANVRRHLYLLVKALPADALSLTKSSAYWNGERVGCDIVDFLRLSSDPRTFAKAVALRQGELCAGVHDDALEPKRQALDERYVAMLTDLADASYKTGRHPDARLYLERLVAADPLDEGHVRALMSLRRETGDRAGALREYNVLAARLRTELDVEPERETTQLFQGILYASDAGSSPHNLTGETNSFVGRETELEEVGARLAGHRLVTILGPAGIGKTRLARRSAFNQLGRFPGGVWFVDLAQSYSRVDVERSVAQVLRGATTPAAPSMPAILHALGEHPALLVLDNCEQVYIDAGEFAAALVASRNASVLATSRHCLEASDESVLHLQPRPNPPGTTHHNAE
ncbi:MAG: AfsR/SARP family transcriptional regulator, partial [Vulcanimicrobiaceae bacterium]